MEGGSVPVDCGSLVDSEKEWEGKERNMTSFPEDRRMVHGGIVGQLALVVIALAQITSNTLLLSEFGSKSRSYFYCKPLI